MNSQEFTEVAFATAQRAKLLRKHIKDIRTTDLKVVDFMQDAVEDLSFTILAICEEFDEDADGQTYRRPQRRKPHPLYDTLAEKRQALEGP